MAEGVNCSRFNEASTVPEKNPRTEELYDKHRDKVSEDIKSGTESFDKYMLTFSSGALALSLAFIKDAVPLKSAVWIASLIGSWTAFVLCIVVTLLSFQFSIKALEQTIPALGEYYLEGKQDAFNRHLKSFCSRAVDWCTVGQILFFALGVIFTMTFVIANVREERVKPENTQKLVTGDLGKAIKPSPMTPLNEGVKPCAMTPAPAGGNEGRGIQSVPMSPADTGAGHKPVPMSPAPTQAPTQSAPGNTPAQPSQSSKD